MRQLADTAKNPKHRDGTVYGHHSTTISAAILMGVAAVLEKGVKARESQRCCRSGRAP